MEILVLVNITKTCLYNFDPLKPHFYIVKLGFTGVYIIFLISAQKQRLWYSLEPPRRGGSNEYLQSMFWAEIWKISEVFIWKFQFLEVKFSTYLHRRVFVMNVSGIAMVARMTSKPWGHTLGWGGGGLTIKKGRGVLPGAWDPYPVPDTIETPFQTTVRRTYKPLCRQTMYAHFLSQLT